MAIRTAIIIAGGRGTRLFSLNDDMPEEWTKIHKSMIKVDGKPLLQRTIEWLKSHGIENVVIGVGHKKESIMDYFGDGSKFGVKITYSHHDADGGTGDAFRSAIENSKIDDKLFFAMNSDQITDFDLGLLEKKYYSSNSKSLATIALVYPTSPYGLVEVDTSGNVIAFREKPKIPMTNNAGIYLFHKDIKEHLSGDVEKNTFVKLAAMGRINSVLHGGYWDTINTYKDWLRVQATLSGGGE